jgi:hypothetical protein
MARNSYIHQKPLTTAQQGYFLTKAFPQFHIKSARNSLRCVGSLQPTPTSDSYTALKLSTRFLPVREFRLFTRGLGSHRDVPDYHMFLREMISACTSLANGGRIF